jgi:hypothetical protein
MLGRSHGEHRGEDDQHIQRHQHMARAPRSATSSPNVLERVAHAGHEGLLAHNPHEHCHWYCGVGRQAIVGQVDLLHGLQVRVYCAVAVGVAAGAKLGVNFAPSQAACPLSWCYAEVVRHRVRQVHRESTPLAARRDAGLRRGRGLGL